MVILFVDRFDFVYINMHKETQTLYAANFMPFSLFHFSVNVIV